MAIQQFAFRDNWQRSTDGQEFSLEKTEPAESDLDHWKEQQGWQPSHRIGGSPGRPRLVPGDANHDRRFDSHDLVFVMTAGKFNTGKPASWEEGDWNADGVFDHDDLSDVFLNNNYQRG